MRAGQGVVGSLVLVELTKSSLPEEGILTYLGGDCVLLRSIVDGWGHDAERLFS